MVEVRAVLLKPTTDPATVITPARTISADVQEIKNRLRVRLLFHSVYQELGLTEAEIESFEDAAAARFNEINIVALQPGIVPFDVENRHFVARVVTLQEVLKTSLGERAVPAFTDFFARASLHEIMDKAAVNSFYLGESMSGAQVRKLIIAATEMSTRDPRRFRFDPKEVDWAAVTNVAETFLSDKQILALKTTIQIEAYDWEVKRLTGNSRRILSRDL